MRKRRQFSKQFKLEAMARLMEDDEKPLRAVAHELGVRPALLSKWKTEYLAEGAKVPESAKLPRDTEVTQLRQEVARLRQERDFLKKAVGFFAQNEN